MSIRLTIWNQIEQVASEHQKSLVPLNDNIPLFNLGLDSLCFAVLVARLEDTLGVDPFTTDDDVTFPVTLGEFVKFYEDAA
jgi:acyl carrier protein